MDRGPFTLLYILTDVALPTCKKSSTDKLLPILPAPYTDIDEPILA
jgi:hypothetical protein